MSEKLLIIALCILAGTMTGLVMSKRLKKRADYFESVIALINLIMSEVKFRKNTTKDIMRGFILSNSSPLNEHLNEYITCDDIKNLVLSKSVLTKAEYSEMTRLLASFGTADSGTQIFELENYKFKFAAIAHDTAEKRKKFSSMYIKLGFFAGLALGIVLM